MMETDMPRRRRPLPLALAAVGLLAAGNAAEATCGQWNVAPSFQVGLANGIVYPMTLRQNGTAFEGSAQFGGAAMPVTGSIDPAGGFQLTLTAGAGALQFNGVVGEGGTLQNPRAFDVSRPDDVGDFTAGPFVCADAPMQAGPPPGGARTGTINGDVDLYDVPGGVGSIIGMLRQGEVVELQQCRDDNWCQVTAGWWFWGDFVDR